MDPEAADSVEAEDGTPLITPLLTGLELVSASCHAGMVGRPKRLGRLGDGVGDWKEGPRLMRSAFRDFNSCWSSARDWVWLSLFFSII